MRNLPREKYKWKFQAHPILVTFCTAQYVHILYIMLWTSYETDYCPTRNAWLRQICIGRFSKDTHIYCSERQCLDLHFGTDIQHSTCGLNSPFKWRTGRTRLRWCNMVVSCILKSLEPLGWDSGRRNGTADGLGEHTGKGFYLAWQELWEDSRPALSGSML